MNRTIAENSSTGRLASQIDICHNEHISIGLRFYNYDSMLVSDNGKTVVREDCMLFHRVRLRADMHRHGCIDILANQKGVDESDPVIGDNAWFGYDVQIMSGMAVDLHSIVGESAIVTDDIPEYVIMGVPTRVIFIRNADYDKYR